MAAGLDDDALDELDPNGLIGVIKIKDGLFICDELGAQVRISIITLLILIRKKHFHSQMSERPKLPLGLY